METQGDAMAWFGWGKKHLQENDVEVAEPAQVAATVAPQVTRAARSARTPGELWVGGVGAYQAALARMPRDVEVELMPWVRGSDITAKVGGVKVGELPYSPKLHEVLFARREAGMAAAMFSGEVRDGDYVPRFLAVFVPVGAELDALAPAGWVRPIPAESTIKVHRTGAYQDALAEAHRPNGRRREAEVTFGLTESGKYAGEVCGTVSLGGAVIGELSAAYGDKWALIYEDQAAGISGRLLVDVQNLGDKYAVAAVYKRSPDATAA